jgi:hypothetical protein
MFLQLCLSISNRQEKLEQLAARFDRKAGMRETWLSENQRLVSQDNFGYDLAAVEAATKKHEAIETDINAYEERVQAVVAVAQELEAENYHDIDRINARYFFISEMLLICYIELNVFCSMLYDSVLGKIMFCVCGCTFLSC